LFEQLIRHTTLNFNIHPDRQAVGRIQDSLSTLNQARDLRLREAESALKSEFPIDEQTDAHFAPLMKAL
jgi:hypothetical protein